MPTVTIGTLRDAYDRYSKFYDFVFGAIFHPGRKEALLQLHLKGGDQVLEVGVGTGLSLSLYPPDVVVTGIDLSEGMLKRAREKVGRENLTHVRALEVMDAQRMVFPDETFDKVVAMYVASVVPDPKQLVLELRRVCKKNGTIILLNHFQNPHWSIRQAEHLATPLTRLLGFHPVFPMEKFIEETGFVIEKKISVGLLDHWTLLVGH